jgi:hypothetical protein
MAGPQHFIFRIFYPFSLTILSSLPRGWFSRVNGLNPSLKEKMKALFRRKKKWELRRNNKSKSCKASIQTSGTCSPIVIIFESPLTTLVEMSNYFRGSLGCQSKLASVENQIFKSTSIGKILTLLVSNVAHVAREAKRVAHP